METNLASRWEGIRLPRTSGKSPNFPGSSPNFWGSSSATSPEVLSLWNLTAIQGFPGGFPDFPDVPRRFRGLPRRSAPSLGSLTPSPDSQKLFLRAQRAVWQIVSCAMRGDIVGPSERPTGGSTNLEGPTRKPRHASAFSTHSDTQAVPTFHCTRTFKRHFFDTRVF